MNISIVVPTFNEPGIGTLIKRIDKVAQTHGFDAQVIVVDDSRDEKTVDAAFNARHSSSVYVTVNHRVGEDRWGGLSGAVLDGIGAADSDIVVVMDGDGQHPPATIVDLLTSMERADLAIASRYIGGGEAGGLDGGFRRAVSSGSTVIARGLFPKRVGKRTTDPMTGFFAVRRSTIDFNAVAKHAVGFKILLALLVTHPDIRVTEVPFTFGGRDEGESKANWRNGAAFLRQVARLRASA